MFGEFHASSNAVTRLGCVCTCSNRGGLLVRLILAGAHPLMFQVLYSEADSRFAIVAERWQRVDLVQIRVLLSVPSDFPYLLTD